MDDVKALVVTPEGDFSSLTIKRENYKVLNDLVGDWIEAIYGTDWMAYLNEEGKLQGLPINLPATTIAISQGWHGGGDILVGTVVFVGRPDEEGFDTSAPERLLELANE